MRKRKEEVDRREKMDARLKRVMDAVDELNAAMRDCTVADIRFNIYGATTVHNPSDEITNNAFHDRVFVSIDAWQRIAP